MSNYKKLQAVLTEVFQLDQADLDFGIYRIMNQKRDAINDFLQNSLPTQVKELLSKNNTGDNAKIQADLEITIKQLKELSVDIDTNAKVKELRSKLAATVSIDSLEQEVFSHLANFFKRYYQGGDFISLRRYKKDVYAIPYEGEEVKLHWANQDQYYIKTSEYLKNYAFKLGSDKLVKFQLKEASTEQNNNKTQNDQERRFAIFEELPVEVNGTTLLINFTYEPHKKSVKQDDLIKKAIDALKANVPVDFADVFALSPTESNKQRTLLDKHLYSFVARHTFDYFIHKDLGGFLRRELDFYIKNEVLYIDDINTENEIAFNSQISKIKALKQVANKIILFLEQLENFQKKLWLKKKFVIAANYCITLDKIPSNYHNEILENKPQLDEWKTLFDVTIKTTKDLENEPFLVLDTKFFAIDFKDRLLSEFEDLDAQTNGLLINSENFQALNLLQEKYKGQVKTTYIDPPYNTGNDGFAYKDGYLHSSWLSLINDRLKLALRLNNDVSSCFLSNIDKRELYNYKQILDNTLGEDKFVNAIVNVNNPKGRSDQKHLPTAHDNILFYANDGFVSYGWSATDKVIKRYNKLDDNGDKYREIDLRKTGDNDRRIDRENLFYYFYFNEETNELFPSREKQDLIGFREIVPMKDEETEGNWRWELKTTELNIKKLLARYMPVKKQWSVFEKDYYVEGDRVSPTSIWDEKPFNSERGTESFLNLGFDKEDFPRPKPIGLMNALFEHTTTRNDIILDYFLGSGTTICGILETNQSTNKLRKYIGCEMGSYFNKITIPRILKTIYTNNWEKGKPQDKLGISQLFKYIVLESYEDTLNNLTLQQTQNQQGALSLNDKVKEEYLLRYMLDVESQDHLFNLDAFKNPFNYKLNVTENNELVPTTVDLVETFNYLIGLKVQKVERIKDFKLVTGENLKGNKILIIWRNLEKTTNDDLNRFVEKLDIKVFDGEFDIIYVNGDNNLSNFKKEEESWKVRLIEEEFFNKMFDNKDI